MLSLGGPQLVMRRDPFPEILRRIVPVQCCLDRRIDAPGVSEALNVAWSISDGWRSPRESGLIFHVILPPYRGGGTSNGRW